MGKYLDLLRDTEESDSVHAAPKPDATEPTHADEALALLNRLKCYSVPAGRMPVIRELAERLSDLATAGGAPDAELVERVRTARSELMAYLQAGAKAKPYPITEHEEARTDRLARTDGWTPPAGIAPEVAAEICRIEPAALALGWRYERLWNSRFWPHSAAGPRGLASVMTPGDEIAEVAADCITILHRRRDLLRFSRIDG